MLTISGLPVSFTEPEFQEFEYFIVNTDGKDVGVPLTQETVDAFNDDSYICVAADVYQTVDIGDYDLELAWSSGAIGEYKGRDSGDDTNLSVFKTKEKGDEKGYFLNNDYALISKELEPFFYGDGENSSALLNQAFNELHLEGLTFNDDEAKQFYDFLHGLQPTQESLDVIVDKNRIIFGVVTNDDSDDESIKAKVDKRWGELAVGDNFYDIRDDTRDV